MAGIVAGKARTGKVRGKEEKIKCGRVSC